MSGTITCTACGTTFRPGTTPGGLCPTCLLARGDGGTRAGTAAGGTAGGADAGIGSTAGAASSRRPAPPSPAELGPLFPQLVIEELLGRGGMGAVYRARQRELDRAVALKILPADTGADPDFAERFRREARALAGLSHPGIVGVHDFGRSGDVYWILMEFVDGLTLRELMADGPVDPQQALSLVRQLCDVLAYAHGRGVVHRDIKPENILVDTGGNVRVVDFGLARLLDPRGDELTLTLTGQKMGTPHYMAPEQWEDPAGVDHRADIYALGVVFYELLTHELPVGRFGPPSEKVHVSVGLDRVVLKALERDRERRYQATTEMRTDVDTELHAGMSGARARKGPLSGLEQDLEELTSGLDELGGGLGDLVGDVAGDVADLAGLGESLGDGLHDVSEGEDRKVFVGVWGVDGAKAREEARAERSELGQAKGGAAIVAEVLWLFGLWVATLGASGAWQAIMFLDWPGTMDPTLQRWLLLWSAVALAVGFATNRVAARRLVRLERDAGQTGHRTWPERQGLLLGIAVLGVVALAVGNQAGIGTIPRQVLHTAGPALFLFGGLGLLVLAFIWLMPRRTARTAEFVVASLLMLAPFGYLMHVRAEELQQNEAMLAELLAGTVPGPSRVPVASPPTAMDLEQLAAANQPDGAGMLLRWVTCEFEARDLVSRAEGTPARWSIEFAEPARSPAGLVLVFDAAAIVDGRRTDSLGRTFVELGDARATHRATIDVDLREVLAADLEREAVDIVPLMRLGVVQTPPAGVAGVLDPGFDRHDGGTWAEWAGAPHTVFVFSEYPADYPRAVEGFDQEAGLRRMVTPERLGFAGLVKDAQGRRAVRLTLESSYLSGALPVAVDVALSPSPDWLTAHGVVEDPGAVAVGGLVIGALPGGPRLLGGGRSTRTVDLTLDPDTTLAAELVEAFLLDLSSGRIGSVELSFRGSRERALSTPSLDRYWAADFRVTVPLADG